MKTIGEFQKLFSPTNDAAFDNLVHEEPTEKQIAFLQQLCQALVIDYARPSSMMAASRKINKLVQEVKNERSRADAIDELFGDVIFDLDLDFTGEY